MYIYAVYFKHHSRFLNHDAIIELIDGIIAFSDVSGYLNDHSSEQLRKESRGQDISHLCWLQNLYL